jgi:hypothetical protein
LFRTEDPAAEKQAVVVHFDYDNEGVIALIPDSTLSLAANNNTVTVTVHPLRAGHVTVTTNTTDTSIK